MSTTENDARWLDGFLEAMWPNASDLIGAEITHEVIATVDKALHDDDPSPPDGDDGPPPFDPDDPGDSEKKQKVLGSASRAGEAPAVLAAARSAVGRRLSWAFGRLGDYLAWPLKATAKAVDPAMELTPAPSARTTFPGEVRALFPPPGTGDHYELTIHVRTLGPVFGEILRFRVTIGLRLAFTFSAGDDPEVFIAEPTLDTNARGDLVDSLEGWKDEVRKEMEGELTGGNLAAELGFLGQARYDTDAAEPARSATPTLLAPERDLLRGGINLVFVADGFDPGDLPVFHEHVERAKERLFTPHPDHINEPFHSIKSALSLWTLVPNQSRDGDVVVGVHQEGPGDHQTTLGSLARLAAVGRSADAATSGPVILVFVANREGDRFQQARADSDFPNAMAMGNVVLHPTRGTDDGAVRSWVSTLLHELGHTTLGNLADEYDRHDEQYRGQPRAAANLESRPDLRPEPGGVRRRFPAWDLWMRHPEQLPAWNHHPITAEEGGGYFREGIWRPAEACAMRRSRDELQFCAVCREALTRAFREVLPADEFLFEVSDASAASRAVRVESEHGRDTALSAHLHVPPNGSGEVRVVLAAGTLPEPWDVRARLDGDGELRAIPGDQQVDGAPSPQRSWNFEAAVGDRLTLEIRSECPFTPWDEDLPTYTVELRCVPDPDATEPPRTPTGLSARQVGRNPAGTPQHARLSASAEDPQGQDVRLEFEIVRSVASFTGAATERTDWLSPAPGQRAVEGEVTHRALDGTYRFRTRARNRSDLTSPWSAESTFELLMPRSDDGGQQGGGHKGGDPGGGPGEGDVVIP